MRYLKFCAHIFIALLFIGFSSAFAQQTGSQSSLADLEGEVRNLETGEAIPGATIYIEELQRGVATDSMGYFQFDLPSPGTYLLQIRSVGYTTKHISVDHPVEERLVLELKPLTIESDEVIVTSSPLGRNIQYQPAQAYNRQQLQEKVAPSLGEILDGSPGVAMRSFGSAPARPVIRGMDGDRVLVLQNGERMGDLSATAHDHAVTLDPLLIDRVEVVRGPASLLYGASALGGVVNLFSHTMPQDWEAGTIGSLVTHGASVNRLGAAMVRARHGTENWALTGNANFREASNIRTPEGRLPSSWLNNYSFGSGFGYRSGNVQTAVAISGMSYDYGLPEALADPNESVELRTERYSLESVTSLEIENGFFKHAELRMTANDYDHQEIEVESRSGQVDEDLDLRFEQRSVTGTLRLRHRPASVFEGVVGVSARFSDMQVSGDEALTPDARNHNLGVFLYEEVALGERVSVQAGSRMEYQQMSLGPNIMFDSDDVAALDGRSDLVFSGSTGVNVRPAPGWEVGLQLARAFRTPTLEELYADSPHPGAGVYEVGDPDLDNEVSLGTDLFVKYRVGRFAWGLSGYLNRVDNFIMFSPTGEVDGRSGLPVYFYNASDALLFGFEFDSKVTLTENLEAGFGADYVRGSRRDIGKSPLPFIPPFRSNVSLRYDAGTWWAGGQTKIITAQERVAPLEEPTGGYTLVGLDAGYRFGHGVTLSARVDNLLNVSYRDHLSRIEDRNNPMPGRNLNLSVRWDF